MTTNKIMFKFAKAGINLSPGAYERVKEKYDNEQHKEEYLDMVIANIKYANIDNKKELALLSEEEAIKWVK